MPLPQFYGKMDPWTRMATESEGAGPAGKRGNSPTHFKITSPESLLTEAEVRRREFLAAEREHQFEQNSNLEGILLNRMRIDKQTRPDFKRKWGNLQTLRRRQDRAESAERQRAQTATPSPANQTNNVLKDFFSNLLPGNQ